jgi:hypothetical protein
MVKEQGDKIVGLKKMRSGRGEKFHCENCGCDRYSYCNCKRKGQLEGATVSYQSTEVSV